MEQMGVRYGFVHFRPDVHYWIEPAPPPPPWWRRVLPIASPALGYVGVVIALDFGISLLHLGFSGSFLLGSISGLGAVTAWIARH